MLRSYQSIYVAFCRWSFKNFGQGRLPQFKSLFNVSFLLIVLLTNVLLLTQLMVKFNWVTVDYRMAIIILLSTVMFTLLNYFILLNNKWLKAVNVKLSQLSKHNLNAWSVVLLVNVMATCGLFIFTVR